MLAPVPSARDSVATAVNPGLRRSMRTPVLGIPDELVDEADAASVAKGFFQRLEAAEGAQRVSASLGRGHPTLDLGGDLPFEVVPKLVVQVVLDARAAEERAHAHSQHMGPAGHRRVLPSVTELRRPQRRPGSRRLQGFRA